MKNLMLLITSLLLFSACKKKANNVSKVFDVSVDFSVVNSNNEDLLNPENTDAFNQSQIGIYYDMDGEPVYYHNTNNYMADHPNAHFFYKEDTDSLYTIRIFLNSDKSVAYPITYIKWNETDMDTIKATYMRTENIMRLDSIWYNNNPIWNFNAAVNRKYFILNK